jgi:hypothetical protein
VPIKAIREGDEVYSMHQGKLAVVPVIAVQQMPVRDHAVVRIRLTGGALLELSGDHPLGDGRTLFDLAPGQALSGSFVEALALVPYEQPFTYDILPDSDTGTYFARGVWLGSTMFGIPR